MVEKIGTIRNPLTIIAIFAAIAEISGTVVLPFIAESNQSTYVWFLMLFPLLLVVLFFATLNFNHRVLYAPSDFKNEENFFKDIRTATPTARAEKVKEEVLEIEAEEVPATAEAVPASSVDSPISYEKIVRQNAQARYFLAEELVLNKLSREFGQHIRRHVQFGRDTSYLYDGVLLSDDRTTAIEVKYFKDIRMIIPRLRMTIERLSTTFEKLPDSMKERFSVIIAIATDQASENFPNLDKRLPTLLEGTPFQVQIRLFNLEELEKEFHLVE